MGTALFVTVQAVIDRMQINENLDGAEDVIKSALSGAHLQVEAALPTDLERVSQDCLYFMDSDAFSGIQNGGMFRLDVPSYFIRKDTPVIITVSDQWRMVNPATLDVGLYSVNYEKGQIALDAYSVRDKFIRVKCDTGFSLDGILVAADPSATPPVSEVRGVEDIPDWVTEAILSYVGVVFDSSQTTKRSNEAKAVYDRAAEHAKSVLAPKLRSRGFVFRHLNK